MKVFQVKNVSSLFKMTISVLVISISDLSHSLEILNRIFFSSPERGGLRPYFLLIMTETDWQKATSEVLNTSTFRYIVRFIRAYLLNHFENIGYLNGIYRFFNIGH